jgi:hypothetical protein
MADDDELAAIDQALAQVEAGDYEPRPLAEAHRRIAAGA